MGKFLRVNLTDGTLRDETLPDEVLRNWIGGRGLGVYLMLKEVDPKVDPFSPDNKLFILTGPLTGTAAPESGRWCSVTKSPLTGTIHDSQSGGKWGPELKFAGYDGIITNCIFENIWILNVGDFLKNLIIVGNHFKNTYDSAVSIGGDYPGCVGNIEGVVVADNTMDSPRGSGVDVYNEAKNVVIANNYIRRPGAAGIWIHSGGSNGGTVERVTVVGNIVETPGELGISLQWNYVSNIIIEGNIINNAEGHNGISVDMPSHVWITNNIVYTLSLIHI